jgi:tetratricopeptide (TPR) repeat protein
MSDAFDRINRLSGQGRRSTALKLLVDEKTGRIRSHYRSDLNHAWYYVGDLYFRAGDFNKALSSFRNSLKHWRGDSHALMAASCCHSELRRPHWAAYYLKKAIRLDRNNAVLFYNLGNAFLDMDRNKAALRQYRHALALGGKMLPRISVEKNIAIARARLSDAQQTDGR